MKHRMQSLRRAIKDDAPALAQLINLAGEGLPFAIWSDMAAPGESVWDVGVRRAGREEGSFSYRNAILALAGIEVAAALVGYPIGGTPTPIGTDIPPSVVPLIELENEALNSWYVNVLATFEPFRKQGFGVALLAEAERQARLAGCRRMSIIVTDRNEAAARLYRNAGYRELERRPIVKTGWETEAESWVLMLKDI